MDHLYQNVTTASSSFVTFTPSLSHGQNHEGQSGQRVTFPDITHAPLLRSNSGRSLPLTPRPSSGSNESLQNVQSTFGHWSAPVSAVLPSYYGNSPDTSHTGTQDAALAGDYANILTGVAGWDLDFINRSEKYDCPICLLVLRDPVQTECGHRFCQGCILKWLRESKQICPVDNLPLHERQLFLDNFAKREILALSVKCPNHPKGCDKIIILKHLQEHLEVCLFSLTACPNQCANILYRGQLPEHLLHHCEKRRIKCALCHSDIIAEKQAEHEGICPQSLVSCPSCKEQMKRAELPHHLNFQCTKAVTPCQYKFLGCGFEAEKCKMDEHEQQSLTYHMSLINRSLVSLLTALRIVPVNQQSDASSSGHQLAEEATGSGSVNLPPNLTNTRESMQYLQRIFQHFNITPNEVNALQNIETSLSLPSPGSQDLNGLISQSGSGLVQVPPTNQIPANQQPGVVSPQPVVSEAHERTDSEETNANRTQSQKLSYFGNVSNRDDNEMPLVSMSANELRSIKSQNDLQDESLARHDQILFDLKHQNECQEKIIRELRVKVKNLETTVQDFEGRCGNGVYLWKIRNYFKLRREAERGEVTAVHSNSFYSCYYGYKLCIRVNLNGVDSAKGTHLSLFIHFMQGEYDDLLEWPFNGRIILTIIDQNPRYELRKDITETLLSKPNLAAFQKPTSTRNHKGFGYMEFLPLSVIDGSTYVKNDTLIIKANVIPSTS